MNDETQNSAKVTGVLITYLPEYDKLLQVINSLHTQLHKLYIIDNTPEEHTYLIHQAISIYQNSNIELIQLKENEGIAKAQNIGIKEAQKDDADYILLSDDDTVFPQDYVVNMLKDFETATNDVVAIAPNFADTNRNDAKQGFVVFKGLRSKRIYPECGLHEVTHAIASGQFIKSSIFTDVGYMREDLFIDWVDLEWCWRVNNAGYKVMGNADILIKHTLGDMAVTLPNGKSYPTRSPLRHYYIVRNAIFLALHSKVISVPMRINLLAKSLIYMFLYPVVAKPRIKNIRYCTLGFWHGLLGKLGKLNRK